jgi:hypothetical protein
LIWLSGLRHPSVPEWPGLPPGRKMLALAALAMLVLTFMPVPIAIGR